MPLIIICGTPVSGKTTRAIELKEVFEKKLAKNVELISEDAAIVKLGYEKNSTYLDSQKEKRVRGYLKSEVLRLIGKDNVVILDGSNYIKGCRYELYCASKASKSTQCTIYTIRNHDEAWEANKERIDRECNTEPAETKDSTEDDGSDKEANSRKGSTVPVETKDSTENNGADKEANSREGNTEPVETKDSTENDGPDKEANSIQDCNKLAYTQEVFDALTKLRFEEPNSNNRWDSPLFTLQPTDELPLDDIYKVLFEKKPPPPNMSTQNPPLTSTNFIYELDKVTQSISKHILDAKQMDMGGELKFPDYPGCTLEPGFIQFISPPRLNMLKRQFLTFAKMNYGNEDAIKIGRYFIQYLNKTLTD